MAPGTPDPAQFLGIRPPVTFDTCEVIEERWVNWMRHDPVVAVETQGENLRRLKALYIDCGEKDQFNLLYGARRFVRRLNELGIAHRYEEFASASRCFTRITRSQRCSSPGHSRNAGSNRCGRPSIRTSQYRGG